MPQEQVAYLDRACGTDTGLRARIEALLKAHGQAGDFLGGGTCSSFGAALKATPGTGRTPRIEDQLVLAALPRRIGDYELLEEIARRDGCGLQGPASEPQPHRGFEAPPGRAVRLGNRCAAFPYGSRSRRPTRSSEHRSHLVGDYFTRWGLGLPPHHGYFPAIPLMALALTGVLRTWHWSVRAVLHVVGLTALIASLVMNTSWH